MGSLEENVTHKTHRYNRCQQVQYMHEHTLPQRPSQDQPTGRRNVDALHTDQPHARTSLLDD